MPEHPKQPTYLDDHGVFRFRPNKIIDWLFEEGLLDLNRISAMPFPEEDRRQLAQLLGYSVSGYYDLSYAENDPVPESSYYDGDRHPVVSSEPAKITEVVFVQGDDEIWVEHDGERAWRENGWGYVDQYVRHYLPTGLATLAFRQDDEEER